jgi:hypothetical protein
VTVAAKKLQLDQKTQIISGLRMTDIRKAS